MTTAGARRYCRATPFANLLTAVCIGAGFLKNQLLAGSLGHSRQSSELKRVRALNQARCSILRPLLQFRVEAR